MIGATNAGGGGSGLGYKVYGGLTAPVAPKVGDIWVKTDTKITKVVMTSEQVATPTWTYEGCLLMITSTAWKDDLYGNMDRRRNMEMYLYPYFAKICINGVWTLQNAYFYNYKNTWYQFSSSVCYLFKPNDLCTAVTGGWKKLEHWDNVANCNVGAYIGADAYGGYTPRLSPVRQIDFTTFKTLHVSGYSVVADNSVGAIPTCFIAIGSTISSTLVINNAVATKNITDNEQDAFTFSDRTMDVSGVTGLQYISFRGTWNEVRDSILRLTNVWME